MVHEMLARPLVTRPVFFIVHPEAVSDVLKKRECQKAGKQQQQMKPNPVIPGGLANNQYYRARQDKEYQITLEFGEIY